MLIVILQVSTLSRKGSNVGWDDWVFSLLPNLFPKPISGQSVASIAVTFSVRVWLWIYCGFSTSSRQ